MGMATTTALTAIHMETNIALRSVKYFRRIERENFLCRFIYTGSHISQRE